MRKGLVVLVPLLAVLVLAPVARAEDHFPPPWDIGEFPTDTFQAWEFTTDETRNVVPEFYENPYGVPLDNITDCDDWGVDPGLHLEGSTWHVGPPNGKHSIQIHNDPNEGIRKEVWVQVTSTAPPISVGSPAAGSSTTPHPHHDWGGGWGTYPYLVTIPGNPALEYIEIVFEFCTWIEEIDIHTRCVPIPEPGLIAVLGLPALLFLRKRK